MQKQRQCITQNELSLSELLYRHKHVWRDSQDKRLIDFCVASTSPSSKVSSFVALLSLSHSLASQQMSNLVNHSEMFPDPKGLGKMTWLLAAILCYQCNYDHCNSDQSSTKNCVTMKNTSLIWPSTMHTHTCIYTK